MAHYCSYPRDLHTKHPRAQRPTWLSTKTDLLGNRTLIRWHERAKGCKEKRDRVDRYKRRKTDPRFLAQYVVARKMSRHRLQLQNLATGRLRIVRTNESRPPAPTRSVGKLKKTGRHDCGRRRHCDVKLIQKSCISNSTEKIMAMDKPEN
ncbi:hypothetical protein AAG570_002722 [Ranatra chinensis]|uniref:Uncharacterized protein n=1 Tax=Ranatra chinensis TaxID=642074 RepID=A0ABD0Y8G5_9HEMI